MSKKFVLPKLFRKSVQRIVQIATVFALSGMVFFAAGILYPRPLTVVLSMSVGHALGAVAAVLYLLAVIIDSLNGSPAPSQATLSEGPDNDESSL